MPVLGLLLLGLLGRAGARCLGCWGTLLCCWGCCCAAGVAGAAAVVAVADAARVRAAAAAGAAGVAGGAAAGGAAAERPIGRPQLRPCVSLSVCLGLVLLSRASHATTRLGPAEGRLRC